MKQTKMQDMMIPSVALGTWSWGFGGIAGGDSIFGNQFDAADLKPVYDRAMDLGLTLWDTATVYGSGASETILGNFVEGDDRAIVSTKFSPVLADGMTDDQKPLEKFLDESRARLHKDVIDIYWIHNTDDVDRWTRALIPLLQSGKVKKVGVSNHNLEQIKYAQGILKEAGFRIHAIQNHFSLLYRTLETTGILDYCKEEDITVFSYMVLEQGALSGKYTVENPLPAGTRRGEAFPPATLAKLQPLFDYMAELATKYDASTAQIATAWAVNKGTVPIIGVTKVAQVDDAAKAGSIELAADEVARMDEIAIATGVTVKGEWEQSM